VLDVHPARYPSVALSFDAFADDALDLQSLLTNGILRANPQGYSTTTGDLVRDLLPL
jgi:hypothetical protein